MIWAIVALALLALAGIGVAVFLYARREEDPFITPRRNYDLNQLMQTAGPLLAAFGI